MDSPHKGPVKQSFDVNFVVSLNKLLKKSSWTANNSWDSNNITDFNTYDSN